MDGGLVVGLVELVECIFVYLQKKIVLNFVMEQNKDQRQIKLLKILAKGCKKHPAYRAIRKATERCEECVVVWQARVELNTLEKS
jgi:hypothetical protein